MKKNISIKKVREGDILAKDIYGFNQLLILREGTVLTDKIVCSLIMKDVRSVWIRCDEDEDKKPPKIDFEIGSYTKRLRETKEFQEFTQKYGKNVNRLRNSINSIVEKNANEETIRLITQEIMYSVNCGSSNASIMDMLGSMRYYDDATFVHCVNVAMICNIFAKWMNMSETDIETATMCGLFHDIGKINVPPDIIKSPKKLTDEEYEEVKKHTLKGYEILKKFHISKDVKLSALSHHERCDGEGYPYGFDGSEINRFAKMVAIADVYDAMTAARVYRGPLCPFKVIQIFEEEGLAKYDPEYILVFLRNVADTYVQNDVRLSDGRIGKIVMINKNCIARPTVVFYDGSYVDLSKELDIEIEEII